MTRCVKYIVTILNRMQQVPILNREECLRALGQVRERGLKVKRGRGGVGELVYACVSVCVDWRF